VRMMKNCLLSALCALLCALSPLTAQVAGATRVAVLEFEVKGNPGMKEAGSAVAEWMSSSLQRTAKYQMLERVLLGKVLEEQSIALSGMIDEKTSAKIGALYGAQAIVTGSLVEWSGRLTLSTRLVDVATGSVLSSAVFRTMSASQLPDRMDEVALVLAGMRPPEVLERDAPAVGKGASGDAFSVVKADTKAGKTRLVLDRGSLDRVGKGMALTIMMPEYGASEVTGARVVLGIRRVGVVVIDYVEPRFCAGEFLPELSVAIPAEALRAEALGIPRSPLSGFMGLGSINAGGAYITSFGTSAGTFLMLVGMEAPMPSLGIPYGGEFVALGYEYPILGNRFSSSALFLGAGLTWKLLTTQDLNSNFGALAYVAGRMSLFQLRLGARQDFIALKSYGGATAPASAMALQPFLSLAIGLNY
jgi:hypothetical protein